MQNIPHSFNFTLPPWVNQFGAPRVRSFIVASVSSRVAFDIQQLDALHLCTYNTVCHRHRRQAREFSAFEAVLSFMC